MIVVTLNKKKDRYLIEDERYPISQYLLDALSEEVNSTPIPKTDVQMKASIGRALKNLDFIPSELSFKECLLGYCCDDYVDIVKFTV